MFCSKHDTDIFKRIEVNFNDIDIETYLYLFLYRTFIYDYLLEKRARYGSNKREIFRDKDYSTKIDKENEIEYLTEQKLTEIYIKNLYNGEQHDVILDKFKFIFLSNEEPTKNDFEKAFDLKYYVIDRDIHFLASGIMAYKFDGNSDFSDVLVSTYALIPDMKCKKMFFAILIPKEEKERMKIVVDEFDEQYKKFKEEKSNNFIKFFRKYNYR